MHFRTSRRSRTTVTFNFGTTALTTVSTYKYLGVFLDKHLNFDKALKELCHSAGRALGTIKFQMCQFKFCALCVWPARYHGG